MPALTATPSTLGATASFVYFMVYRVTFCFVAFIFIVGCAFNTEVKIIPVDSLVDTETVNVNGKVQHDRNDYFLLEGGVGRKDNIKAAIGNFIYLHGENIQRYNNYHMKFYRKTKQLNPQKIKEYPENLRWKAFVYEKPVYDFYYQGGKLLFIFE